MQNVKPTGCRPELAKRWASFTSQSDVRSPSPRNESQALIESMHTRITAAALHQNVVAVLVPGSHQRGADDGTAVASSAKVRMRDYVFEEGLAPALTREVWRG